MKGTASFQRRKQFLKSRMMIWVPATWLLFSASCVALFIVQNTIEQE